MKFGYFIINLLFIFTLQKHLVIIHAQEQLARLWNIPVHLIPRYLERELHLNNVNKILELYLDDSNFAGTYIDVKSNSVIIYTVNMTKKHDITSKPNIREYERFLDFRKVNKSLAYLKSSFKELDRMAKQNRPRGIYTSIHPRFNKIIVIVSLPPDQRIQAFIGAARQYDADIYFDLSPTITSTHTKRGAVTSKISSILLSGDGIGNKFDGSFCSAGFWARSKNQTLLVTAGHCNGKRFSRSMKKFFTLDTKNLIGKMIHSSIAPHDIGLIDIKKMSEYLRPSTNIKNDKNASYLELFVTDGVPIFSHGAHLCRSGISSLVSCGYVDAFNGIYVNKDENYQSDLTFVDKMSCTGGDSGGPAFSFSDFLDFSLVNINGIVIVGADNATSPLYPFTIVLPREIILNSSRLDFITEF
ncbi:4196_t:CDS:1 [Cetraspora pellucida]|uniref:4196_t:CDS:1 n=1 Tax=Cetraspora pellucida TaxID=1433469 RepID=A0A9N8W2A1_9GLOM|nr:4196_t:CDS:1 [Cetraspora pellucida]